MTGRSVGRSCWLVGRPVAALCCCCYYCRLLVVWLGQLVPLPERGHLGSQRMLSYVANFLHNEAPRLHEMTSVIKASSNRRSGISVIFTMGNARLYIIYVQKNIYVPTLFCLSLSLFLCRPSVFYRNVFIYIVQVLLRISGCFSAKDYVHFTQ